MFVQGRERVKRLLIFIINRPNWLARPKQKCAELLPGTLEVKDSANMGGGGVPVQKCTQHYFAKGLCFLPPIDNHSDCTEEYFKKDWCMMEVHHRSIFQLRDKFQAQHSGLMLIAVIALTILLEHIVEMIEKRVEGRHARVSKRKNHY